jgi:hypothetical protein
MSESVDTAAAPLEAPPDVPAEAPVPAEPEATDPETGPALTLESLQDEVRAAMAAHQAAEEEHKAALATLSERHAASAALSAEREREVAELAKLDALPELDMPQLLRKVNGEKRIRTLDAQIGEAQAAITAADEEERARDKLVKLAKVRVNDASLVVLEAQYFSFARDAAERMAALRTVAFQLKREADRLEFDPASSEVNVAVDTPRGRRMLAVPESRETPFLSNVLEDARHILANLEHEQQIAIPAAQMEHAATTRGLFVDRGHKGSPDALALNRSRTPREAR